jgi:sialic acid synthase SpsE
MAKEIELAPGRWVGGSHPCFIIAEVGQNHQGDMVVAKTLIRAAKVGMILIIYILFKCIIQKSDLLASNFSRKGYLHIL